MLEKLTKTLMTVYINGNKTATVDSGKGWPLIETS